MRVPLVIVNRLRRNLRDFPELNNLLNNQYESSDESLAENLADALSDWNAASPYMPEHQVNFVSFFIPATGAPTTDGRLRGILYLVIRKAAIITLQSVGVHQQRNELQYNTGNSSVAVNDKWKNFQTTIQQYMQDYETKRDQIKGQINMEDAPAVIHTDMWYGVRGDQAFIDVL